MKVLLIIAIQLCVFLPIIQAGYSTPLKVAVIQQSLETAKSTQYCFDSCEQAVDGLDLSQICNTNMVRKLQNSDAILDVQEVSLYQDCMTYAYQASQDQKVGSVFNLQQEYIYTLQEYFIDTDEYKNFSPQLKFKQCTHSALMMYGFDSKFYVNLLQYQSNDYMSCKKFRLFQAVERMGSDQDYNGKRTLQFWNECLEDDKNRNQYFNLDMKQYTQEQQNCLDAILEEDDPIFQPGQLQDPQNQIQLDVTTCHQDIDCDMQCLSDVHYEFFKIQSCPDFLQAEYPFTIDEAKLYKQCLLNVQQRFEPQSSQATFNECQIQKLQQQIDLKEDEPSTEEPGQEEPTTEEPGQEEPTTEEPGQEEPSTEEPGQEEPTKQPGQEEPTTEEPTSEEPDDDVDPGRVNGSEIIGVQGLAIISCLVMLY